MYRNCIRTTGGQLFGRAGGEKFVPVLEDCHSPNQFDGRALKLSQYCWRERRGRHAPCDLFPCSSLAERRAGLRWATARARRHPHTNKLTTQCLHKILFAVTGMVHYTSPHVAVVSVLWVALACLWAARSARGARGRPGGGPPLGDASTATTPSGATALRRRARQTQLYTT